MAENAEKLIYHLTRRQKIDIMKHVVAKASLLKSKRCFLFFNRENYIYAFSRYALQADYV